jgi:hypothetical protein
MSAPNALSTCKEHSTIHRAPPPQAIDKLFSKTKDQQLTLNIDTKRELQNFPRGLQKPESFVGEM